MPGSPSPQMTLHGIRCATSGFLSRPVDIEPARASYCSSGVPRRLLARARSTSPPSPWRFTPWRGFPTARRSMTATFPLRMPPAARPLPPEPRGGRRWSMLSMRGVDVPVIEVQPQSDVEGFAAQLDVGMFVNPGSASVRRADMISSATGTGSSNWPARHTRHGWTGATGQDRAFRRRRSFGRRFACWSTGPRTRYRHRGRRDRHARRRAGYDGANRPIWKSRSAASIAASRRAAGVFRGPFRAWTDLPTPGSRDALARSTLVARYRDASRYLSEFTEALDATIRAGYLLPADREQILRDAADQARNAFAAANEQEVLIP